MYGGGYDCRLFGGGFYDYQVKNGGGYVFEYNTDTKQADNMVKIER